MIHDDQKPRRAGDRALLLLLLNEEFPVSVNHQLALITDYRISDSSLRGEISKSVGGNLAFALIVFI